METLHSLTGYALAHAGAFIIILGAVSIAGLVFGTTSLLRFRSICRPLESIKSKTGDRGEYMPVIASSIEDNRKAIEDVASGVERLLDESSSYLKHIGLVRYDAFDDVGGKQSYSLCLLDGDKNGFIITYLTGHNFTRSYAVAIDAGAHSRKLSEEEIQACAAAVSAMQP